MNKNIKKYDKFDFNQAKLKVDKWVKENSPENYGKKLYDKLKIFCFTFNLNSPQSTNNKILSPWLITLYRTNTQIFSKINLNKKDYSQKIEKIIVNKKENNYKASNKLPFTGFYACDEWRALRLKVFAKYGKICMKCNSKRRLHVDHIKPRSLYPELELDFNNLQVLCETCNVDKSNLHEIDYRPKQ